MLSIGYCVSAIYQCCLVTIVFVLSMLCSGYCISAVYKFAVVAMVLSINVA